MTHRSRLASNQQPSSPRRNTMSNSEQVGTFFQDPDASSAVVLAAQQQITAPMIVGTELSDEEVMMGGGLRVVYFAMDRSPSMEPVADALLNGFNQDFVPAV